MRRMRWSCAPCAKTNALVPMGALRRAGRFQARKVVRAVFKRQDAVPARGAAAIYDCMVVLTERHQRGRGIVRFLGSA